MEFLVRIFHSLLWCQVHTSVFLSDKYYHLIIFNIGVHNSTLNRRSEKSKERVYCQKLDLDTRHLALKIENKTINGKCYLSQVCSYKACESVTHWQTWWGSVPQRRNDTTEAKSSEASDCVARLCFTSESNVSAATTERTGIYIYDLMWKTSAKYIFIYKRQSICI